jgi:antitoxin CptB
MMETTNKRMLWRCRRGMLELDIVLQNFVEAHYAGLTASQLQALDQLLDYADNDLWDLLTARKEAQHTIQRELLAMILTPAVKNDKIAAGT